MEIHELKKQLIEWMGEMKYGYTNAGLYLATIEKENSYKEGVKIILYTEVNEYCITAYPPVEEDPKSGVKNYGGYLGATMSSRKKRAGESWTRGNDLADGEFSRETWVNILSDIVGAELVKIHRPIAKLLKDIRDKVVDG